MPPCGRSERSRAAEGRATRRLRVVKLRTAKDNGAVAAANDQHLTGGQRCRGMSETSVKKRNGAAPRAALWVIQLGAVQGAIAIHAPDDQDLACGQQRRRVTGATQVSRESMVGLHKPLSGAYTSALSRKLLPFRPPATRTLPVGRSVAVWMKRAWSIEPTSLHVSSSDHTPPPCRGRPCHSQSPGDQDLTRGQQRRRVVVASEAHGLWRLFPGPRHRVIHGEGVEGVASEVHPSRDQQLAGGQQRHRMAGAGRGRPPHPSSRLAPDRTAPRC